ncbi:MAG: T9SS type A sorting domain-containing protein [Chitinophagaceae bacterium]|nr:T9SS type A sorting domain-containing protein [Chitinophagaceae bacterium]
MKSIILLRILIAFSFIFILIPSDLKAQANCASAQTLTPSVTCTTVSGDLQGATSSGPAGACGGATLTTTNGRWFKFTATSSSVAIEVSISNPTFLTLASTYIEVLSGTCVTTLTSIACQAATSPLNVSSLVIGTEYFVRVYVTGSTTSGAQSNRRGFSICIILPPPPPTNDECAGSTLLNTYGTSCGGSTSGTLLASTPSTAPIGCATPGTLYDVWYRFVAGADAHLVTLSSFAGVTNPQIQIYSGTCGTLTSITCGTTSVAAGGLISGTTYYVRVSGSSASGTPTFNICVTTPAPSNIDYSRSYINVTKGTTGGTVDPGDTLEMRATFVVRTSPGSADSLSFTDTLFSGNGFRLVPGSIAVRTNEGKIYGSPFTDAFDTDAGWAYQSGSDTVIRINFGAGASNTTKGQLNYNSRPSVFGSTCIIMATYRVVVYAPYDTRINFKTGSLTYRDRLTTAYRNITFAPNELVVYQSPGLCPNAVSASNALGGEFNGTFGSGTTQNRTASPFTSYGYMQFNPGGPNDYFHGIANNTSTTGTIITTWAKPNSNRVHSVWDISGDHTGAANPLMGNPPTAPGSNGGYMLVINSAYKTDTAFTYTISNLCPNTYYELSGWFKNICYKCGCDSLGTGASSAGYIPTAPGDSSGVRPNIAFDVNGADYFTTGDIFYTGTTNTGSDATNQWIKRGFVYLTGPSETSFTLTLRNNAPGGGGNDWALDDISVATCLPNMQYSPSLTPNVCVNNPITINDTIRSYFDNYVYYKWQQSTDAGSTWTDVTSAQGPASPVYNGTAWEYVTSYTVPPTETNFANNNDRYRVVVATGAAELSTSDCLFTDGISLIDINVITCTPLTTDLLSFTGKKINELARLYWTTSQENQPIAYNVERSNDGINFENIGIVNGNNNTLHERNHYTFNDPKPLTTETTYRIVMKTDESKKVSRHIRLLKNAESLKLLNVINPFHNEISFDIIINENANIVVSLLDMYGKQVRSKTMGVYEGANNLSLENIELLPAGIYILQVRHKDQSLSKRIFKK